MNHRPNFEQEKSETKREHFFCDLIDRQERQRL